MSGDWGYLVIVEGVLIFGGVLAFGFWELHKLKKLRQAREAQELEDQELEDQELEDQELTPEPTGNADPKSENASR